MKLLTLPLYLPTSQSWQSAVFDTNCCPAMQNLHVTEATAFCSWYLPLTQDAPVWMEQIIDKLIEIEEIFFFVKNPIQNQSSTFSGYFLSILDICFKEKPSVSLTHFVIRLRPDEKESLQLFFSHHLHVAHFRLEVFLRSKGCKSTHIHKKDHFEGLRRCGVCQG